MKKLFSLIITVIMIVSVLPFSVLFADEKTYCITLDGNGGVIDGKSVYGINYGDCYYDIFGNTLPNAAREGYTLVGWLCEKYGYMLNLKSNDYYAVHENTVFKAVWEKSERDYTITLDPDGGTMTAKSEYTIDRNEFYVDRIGEIMPYPVREGYSFDGWYNEKYDFKLSILPTAYHKYDESLTFIALWAKEENEKAELKKDWLITLDGNGGDVIGQSIFPANTGEIYTDIFGTELSAYRPGFTLSGWYCEKYNYTLELNGMSYFAVAEDVIFEAVWTKNNYLGIGVDGYNVILSRADEISHIRYAKGIYSDAVSIKNAEDCIDLNERVISSFLVDGLFVKEMPEIANYSFWVKYKDGSTNILLAKLTSPLQYVCVEGLTLNINGLHGVRDIFIAKGNFKNYSEIKNNGGVQVSVNKIGDKHSYAYNVSSKGEYSVCIRYTDASKEHKIIKVNVCAKEPVYTPKGLQLEISGIENVKVIRTAYGDFSTAGDIKRAQGSIGFSAKYIGDKSTYTIQYRNEGRVSVAVVYQNGNTDIFSYDIKKLSPEIEAVGKSIYLSNLDGLSVIRYAIGEYQSVNEIKTAYGNKYVKNIEGNDYIIKDLEPGRYTVYVQYNDGSKYFYHTYLTNRAVDATGVKVSSAFTDNMILQRDEKLSVWGFADEKSNGKTVAVSLGAKSAYATVENGEWKAVFDETFSYNTIPQDLKIYSADGIKVINDVLIGDVYFIIGQSNVHYTILEEINDLKYHGLSHELEVDFDDSRNMRFFRISNADYTGMTGEMKQGTAYEYEDVYNGRVWQKPSNIEALINRNASTYEVFSALGYLFAYNVTNEIDVPIGVIQIEASGHPLTSFAPNHLAQKWGDEWYDSSSKTYRNSFGSPSRYVYNQQIHPLRHFSIAGLIWYQGESDEYNTVERQGIGASTFKNEFTELMTYFRSAFGNSDFPVYLNEFPAHTGGFDFGCARVEVGTVPQLLENSYVVPASDTFSNITWYNSIHPYVKRIQANRLCNMVLANRFGVGNIEYVSGPLLESVYYSENKATLDFRYTAGGLTTFASEDFDNGIIGIEILCNGSWITANAVISDADKIEITSDHEISGVRYYRQSSGYYPVHANLCNSEGIPCTAFVDYK